MLTTWGQGESDAFRQLMLGFTGAVIVIFIIVMAVFMIAGGNKRIREMKCGSEVEKTRRK